VPHDWKSLLFFMKISLQCRNGGGAVSDQSDASGKDKGPFLKENFIMAMAESQIFTVRIRLCEGAI
jgi:hypothetical protein